MKILDKIKLMTDGNIILGGFALRLAVNYQSEFFWVTNKLLEQRHKIG